jgi:DNA polymerase III subunit delta'
MNPLPPLIGHADVRAALGASAQRGDLPASLLLHGPVGIGKQRFALWIAQRLLCQQPRGAEPCGTCKACQLTSRIEHPDLHWFFPLPRPKSSGGPDKLGEALEQSRAEELMLRREHPFRPILPGELSGIYLAQVLTLRRLAVSRPSMGPRKVFIIGDAESLVSQEASTEAANALLKLLEEPPPDTTIIVTASDPDELLPTIRSRLLPVRMHQLPEEEVTQALVHARGVSQPAARLAARLSEGSIGRALAFLPDDGEPGPLEVVRAHARDLLDAAIAPKPTARLGAALNTSPAGARGAFVDTLDFLAAWIRDLGAVASGAPEVITNVDAEDHLRALAGQLSGGGRGISEALRSIDLARGLTRSNVNPQLTLANLLEEVGRALRQPV